MEEYKKELFKVIEEYFDKAYEVTKDMSLEEEEKYIEDNNIEQEIRDIYDKLQKKHNINLKKK